MAILIVAALGVLPGGAGMAPSLALSRSGALPNLVSATSASGVTVTNVSYNATTDGFPLSFAEILPASFHASSTYSLLVYLHGEGKSSNWVRGGSGNDLANYTNTSIPNSKVLTELVENASTSHFIIIGPSPRTSDGFFTNSPCGGPQEQDTLDAIAVEQSRHHISSVYLLGFSMGSLGALSLAGHHPTEFAGLAVVGTITDAFEDFDAHVSPHSGLLPMACNEEPSTANASVVSLFSYLSIFRFHPQNFSQLPLWVAAGGADHGAPDNSAFAPYLQVNDTILNSTCLVASAFAEPANCTAPWAHLHALNGSLFHYRFVYEALAGHSLAQLSPGDMFRYLLGKEGGGCFDSTFPPARMTACP